MGDQSDDSLELSSILENDDSGHKLAQYLMKKNHAPKIQRLFENEERRISVQVELNQLQNKNNNTDEVSCNNENQNIQNTKSANTAHAEQHKDHTNGNKNQVTSHGFAIPSELPIPSPKLNPLKALSRIYNTNDLRRISLQRAVNNHGSRRTLLNDFNATELGTPFSEFNPQSQNLAACTSTPLAHIQIQSAVAALSDLNRQHSGLNKTVSGNSNREYTVQKGCASGQIILTPSHISAFQKYFSPVNKNKTLRHSEKKVTNVTNTGRPRAISDYNVVSMVMTDDEVETQPVHKSKALVHQGAVTQLNTLPLHDSDITSIDLNTHVQNPGLNEQRQSEENVPINRTSLQQLNYSAVAELTLQDLLTSEDEIPENPNDIPQQDSKRIENLKDVTLNERYAHPNAQALTLPQATAQKVAKTDLPVQPKTAAAPLNQASSQSPAGRHGEFISNQKPVKERNLKLRKRRARSRSKAKQHQSQTSSSSSSERPVRKQIYVPKQLSRKQCAQSESKHELNQSQNLPSSRDQSPLAEQVGTPEKNQSSIRPPTPSQIHARQLSDQQLLKECNPAKLRQRGTSQSKREQLQPQSASSSSEQSPVQVEILNREKTQSPNLSQATLKSPMKPASDRHLLKERNTKPMRRRRASRSKPATSPSSDLKERNAAILRQRGAHHRKRKPLQSQATSASPEPSPDRVESRQRTQSPNLSDATTQSPAKQLSDSQSSESSSGQSALKRTSRERIRLTEKTKGQQKSPTPDEFCAASEKRLRSEIAITDEPAKKSDKQRGRPHLKRKCAQSQAVQSASQKSPVQDQNWIHEKSPLSTPTRATDPDPGPKTPSPKRNGRKHLKRKQVHPRIPLPSQSKGKVPEKSPPPPSVTAENPFDSEPLEERNASSHERRSRSTMQRKRSSSSKRMKVSIRERSSSASESVESDRKLTTVEEESESFRLPRTSTPLRPSRKASLPPEQPVVSTKQSKQITANSSIMSQVFPRHGNSSSPQKLSASKRSKKISQRVLPTTAAPKSNKNKTQKRKQAEPPKNSNSECEPRRSQRERKPTKTIPYAMEIYTRCYFPERFQKKSTAEKQTQSTSKKQLKNNVQSRAETSKVIAEEVVDSIEPAKSLETQPCELTAWLKSTNAQNVNLQQDTNCQQHDVRFLSRDLLVSEQHKDVEFRFYNNQSDEKSLGYIIFKPKAVKKMVPLKHCGIRFVCLTGEFKFKIKEQNSNEVTEQFFTAGDAFAVRVGDKYSIENLQETGGGQILMIREKQIET